MATPRQGSEPDLPTEWTEAVRRGQWRELLRLVHPDHCSPQPRRWAIEKILYRAPTPFLNENLDEICDNYADNDSLLTHLPTRHQWKYVGRVLQRDISHAQHRQTVEKASRRADDDDFLAYILPCCYDEDLDSVLTPLVSRGLWRSVDKVLERGVSSSQHRWAVEQASRHAEEEVITHLILPHCSDKEREHVLSHTGSLGLREPVDSATRMARNKLSRLMSRKAWGHVGKFLQGNFSGAVHAWAVEQASKQCDDVMFNICILPQCYDEELDSVLTHLVSRNRWRSVDKVLERGVSSSQHRWAVEQASRHAHATMFASFILHHCADEELEQVFSHTVSRGLWKPVEGVADMVEDMLSWLVSQRMWRYVGRFLQRNISVATHTWAVEQARKQCSNGVFVGCILPYCYDEELDSVLIHMVSQGFWRSVGKVLERGVSSSQHKWAVEQASKYADDDDVVRYILSRCFDEELECVLPHLVSQGMWKSVDRVLERGVSPSLHRSVLVESAGHADDSNYHMYLLHHCHEEDVVAVFPHLVANKRWTCVQHVLWIMARDTLHMWMTSERGSRSRDTLFCTFIRSCHIDGSLAFGLTKAATQQRTYSVFDVCRGRCYNVCSDLADGVSFLRGLCELFITTLVHILCDLVWGDCRQLPDSSDQTKHRVSDIFTHITAYVEDNTHCVQYNTLVTTGNREKWSSVFTELANTRSNDPLFLIHFLQDLHLYYTSRRGENDDAALLVMLAVFPLFPQLQSVALRIMLREKRWDVLSQACLSHVWEHDRRRLFTAAVMQRQWDVVRQWCDHTVHDDQRHWALTEAFKEKQWEVYLLLADHGLTVDEQMYAHYRVAKYGHWATVLNMVDRGGDITEVSNLLEKWVMRYLRKKPEGDVTVYEQRCMKLIRLRLRFAQKSVLSPRKALERCLWGTVLFNILHKPTRRFFSEVLDKVLEEQEWHVLMHLVRLGMTSADRDRLFPDMVRQQQWGVCRQLLEHGVDDQLCLEALPELMEKNQWMLVARVMEHDVDDTVKRQVLLWAFQRRTGALFWHCLFLLEERLSTTTQHKLFYQAISREIWQAVKPLVKEKDGPNIQRRDLAFLEAIEQHLWDVVDYCQRLGADINMKDENGETPLNREARKREWKAVEEIVLREGDPNHLDKDGVSLMNRLIHHKKWDIVKVVIKYGGDIHLSARYSEAKDNKTHSPLQALISARQADVIHSTIKWCGGQDWGVNDEGERVLHAVCDSDRWDVMRDLIDIKVNPLVLTSTGKSPLAYAVLNTKCGQRMVAECSRQGFSFHQPSLTGPQETLLQDVSQIVLGISPYRLPFLDYVRWESKITSPLLCAMLCNLPVMAFMLYESGSCSNTELFTLHTQLPKLTDHNTKEGQAMHEEVDRKVEKLHNAGLAIDYVLQRYSHVTHSLSQSTAFLKELATTPRPLLSSCRLKILQSPCFHFSHKHREKAMGYDYLRLPESLKEYLRFSDLCDPDYGGHMK